MRFIDDFLNKYTMYFIILWTLRFLVACSVALSFFGILNFKPIDLIASFLFLVGSCWIINKIFAKVFKVAPNKESYTITALILYFILLPSFTFLGIVTIALASFFAMGSKYLLTINKRHIFNPAAFSLVLLGIIGSTQVGWWVASTSMLPLVLVAGLVIIRKIRKFQMVFSFVVTYFVASVFLSNMTHLNFNFMPAIISTPLIFFMSIMLVEPFTTPPRKKEQILYAILVGSLLGSQLLRSFPVFATFEGTLLIGNIFSFAVSFKERLILTLAKVNQLSAQIFEFQFKSNRKFAFSPGQYMEWTLSHPKSDFRGIRRYFSVASSPTEDQVILTSRFDKNNRSTFKKALMELKPGDKIYAGSLSGDFVLPFNQSEKLAFIAGGIGITPFRSMIKFLIDKNQKRDIVLLYAASNESDFVFKDIFAKAEKVGLKTLYLTKRLDSRDLKKELSDLKERKFYLSGPKGMVDGYKTILRSVGVSSFKIVTDYFPGY